MARPIKLMNDYGAGWPLWDSTGPLARDDLSISPDLRSRIVAWTRVFDEHFRWDEGWDNAELATRHGVEAREIHRLLAEELGPHYDVRLDLWEA